jgi:hypothetical protein
MGPFNVMMAMVLMAIVASASQQVCTPGTFMYFSECPLCPSGTFSAQHGATECTACSAGKFSFCRGSTSCELCSAGTYSEDANSKICTVCPSGKYAKNPGSTACNSVPNCPAGTSTFSISYLFECFCPERPGEYCWDDDIE